MRMLSVNTWLIIINVAVWLVGAFALPLLEREPTWVGAGRVIDTRATPDEIARAKPDTKVRVPIPQTPGYYGHPLMVDVRDAAGRTVVDPRGVPLEKQIGWDRYAPMPRLHAYGHFSTGKAFLEMQLWRFISFQFLHADVTHLLFNMLGLWFVGSIVEEYLGRRRYLAFYTVCGMFGAISYLVLNFVGFLLFTYMSPSLRGEVPALLFDDIYTPLIGASAGVFGVLMAAAYIAPNEIVDVMLILPMRMRTAVYIFLGLAAINLFRGGQNAGGDAAHVGGAIAGAFFIRRTHLLRDFFDILGDSRKGRRPGIPTGESTRVEEILAKVKENGMESLTAGEREVLRRASEAAREMDRR